VLDITFKQTEDELYELRAQFGRDVDPDALLSSIGSLLEMVKKTFPSANQSMAVPKRSGKKERVVEKAGDTNSIIANMPDASKALLISLFDYEQKHGEPVEEIRDIIKYAQRFRAYTDFMEGKDLKQEVQALRYQVRLLRDRGLLQSQTDRSLALIGIEVAKRLKLELEPPAEAEDDGSGTSEQILDSARVQESDQELVTQPSDGRLHFEHS